MSDDFKEIKKEIEELKSIKSKLLKEKAEKEKAEKEKAEKEKAEKEKAEKEKAEYLKTEQEKWNEQALQTTLEDSSKETPIKEQESSFAKVIDWISANKIPSALIGGLLIFSIFSNLESNNNQSDNPTLVADSTTTSIVEDQKDPNIVSDLQDVINAVVRIESLGLIDSEGYQEVGVGSGFFISNDGYIVTNNHVVAGSQGVEVNTNFSDLPIPASIVATSECNDGCNQSRR